MTILDDILARKRSDVEMWKRQFPVYPDGGRGAGPDFLSALKSAPMAVIAEVKRRSPSAGAIREPMDAAELARAYAENGAQAISVLIDQPFFGGGPADFRVVREAVDLPMLFKEFVVDPWQVAQASSLGASAVLLIVAALTPDELRALMTDVRGRGMTPLVEVHDEAELDVALESGADCVGINNRDLKTFCTSLETSFRLLPRLSGGVTAVSESGIRAADDLRRLRDAGARAVLVGESLLREADPGAALRALRGAPSDPRRA
ncbi:MAG: indole-3-glycerol phosphate synthase TrpC [Kiritimatiellae bacterium]|nr:indole-3-glycerol phosphate synthase TrpC [Kiritimatiellia bacterium]